jgi:hypothetical protein
LGLSREADQGGARSAPGEGVARATTLMRATTVTRATTLTRATTVTRGTTLTRVAGAPRLDPLRGSSPEAGEVEAGEVYADLAADERALSPETAQHG